MAHDPTDGVDLTGQVAIVIGDHGVKFFAIEPGTVRTDMAEYASGSEAGRRWMPWFQDIFEQGQDVPPDHAARLVVLLAWAMVDALSGRFFTISYDVIGLVDQVERGRTDDFRRLRLGHR